MRFLAATALLIAALALPYPDRPVPLAEVGDSLPLVHPNDNRTPAGRLHGDTLELSLEVGRAIWYPEADSGSSIAVSAFREAGHEPQIPGPLIRVPTGSIIVASVRNRLTDSTIAVHGLLSHPASERQPAAPAGGLGHRHLHGR